MKSLVEGESGHTSVGPDKCKHFPWLDTECQIIDSYNFSICHRVERFANMQDSKAII